MSRKKLAKLRYDYSNTPLEEAQASLDPFQQFESWFGQALNAGFEVPNAMAVATAHRGKPSVRIVLLKDYTREGFVFFTHYTSAKGRALAANPNTEILFYWPEIERQIRITGRTAKISAAQSTEYFHSRPRQSQIGALASDQSRPLENRATLETACAAIERKFAGKPLPRPATWGGYILKPQRFEFWQGRPSRLHDRLIYLKKGSRWIRERLYP
ncbi:MAG: pyridoxamine 5'-phosphate oxidase [Candidatus Omnitrophica bacterium]|nr:pyridoxamine 5'-phosphate oxidase [Candidatus Omnitrophota bacterium]